MSKKPTFPSEDVNAVNRALQGTNHPDHFEEAASRPNMGSDNRESQGSQSGGAGSGIPARERASEKSLPKGAHKRALDARTKIENGQARGDGGEQL